MNGTITKVVFPHVDELRSVPVLPATAPRGWAHEPMSEEPEWVIAPDAPLPSSIDAERSHPYIWENAAAAADHFPPLSGKFLVLYGRVNGV